MTDDEDDGLTQEERYEIEQVKGIIGALQLLLGGKRGEDKAALIRHAFPGLIVSADFNEMRVKLFQHLTLIEAALGIVDGSSGLGALAAKDANHQIRAIRDSLFSLANFLEIDELASHNAQKPGKTRSRTKRWIT